jgi:hypothetical protein
MIRTLTQLITAETDPRRTAPSPNRVRWGLLERRFVAPTWFPPVEYPHLKWCVLDDPDAVEYQARVLKDHPTVTWYLKGQPFYTAEVTYSPERPRLVLVGGFQ